MIKLVVCKVSVPGFHRWENAFEEVNYLRNRHRHIFEIIVGFRVTDNDREVEIIDTQNKITRYLLVKYGIEHSVECDFDTMSCEDIAEDILTRFNAYYTTVTEDGFGGSTIINN